MSSFQSDCIIRQGLYTIYTRVQVPKLYRYVYEGKWHKIPLRCKTHPRETKFIHRYAPCDTALHRLLRPPEPHSEEYEEFLRNTKPDMQAEIVQLRLRAVCALMEANPPMLLTPDCFGQTPLHLACVNVEYTMGAAEMLLNACPRAALIQDTSGKTPLHYLISGDQNVPTHLIEMFVKTAPEALKSADRRGLTPVDIAKLKAEKSDSLLNLFSGTLSDAVILDK